MTLRAALQVGYLDGLRPGAPETTAVQDWLRTEESLTFHPIPAAQPRLPEALDVVWLHSPDQQAFDVCGQNPSLCAVLKDYVARGGGLLLTGFAALLPHTLGFESHRPEARPRTVEDAGYGRALGFQSFRGHPLFDDFHGGAYLWYGDEDHTTWRVGYFEDDRPAQGRVVGIEKGYLTLYPEHKLLIEHTAGAGRLLSAGAFIHFAPANHRALHTRRFIRNALHYLARPPATASKATYWIHDTAPPQAITPSPSRPPADAPDDRDLGERSGLSLVRDEATDAFFDVAGRRCLMMGTERGGLDEVWTHPFRLLRDVEVGLCTEGGVRWLREIPARVEIRPEAVVRTYRLGTETLTETLVAALDRPGGFIRLHADGTKPIALLIRFRVDFRWMWPYPPGTLGALRYGYDEDLYALHVHDRSGDVYALYGADHQPDAHLGGAFARIDYAGGVLRGTPTDVNQVCQAFCYTLDAQHRPVLHAAFAGSSQGRDDAEQTFRTLLSRPADVHAEAARHYRRLLTTSTTLTTPDPTFDEGYRWALVGTDRFRATTPGLGTGLMAGYATSDRGWDGGHADSGRPGYAWYFGRDAAWAGLAVCAYGDFETVRQQLHLFRDFQDVSGKIFHELTTSGSVHYDAADATPLYIILAAHYVRASGDLDTLHVLWPSLQHALAFLSTTDTDDDGLIENTNVGHGWVEGGALFGAHTTFYLAALWTQALYDATYLAELCDAPASAGRYGQQAEDALIALEQFFWNHDTRFFNHSKRPDGTFNTEPTVLPAVAMLFGLLNVTLVDTMLDAWASNAFTTDWGLRILSMRSPLFDPQHYHSGTIWPLFTGWTALAEYTYGRSASAFAHVMSNVLLYRHHTLGTADEVLHGTAFTARRVCPHQCWSETGALHPILAGLVGFHPDAPRRRVRLEPRLPLHWKKVSVDNLRIGDTRIRFSAEQQPTGITYRLARLEGPVVEVCFAPEITPYGRCSIKRDGIRHAPWYCDPCGLLAPPLIFSLADETVITLCAWANFGVLPYVPDLSPDAASQEYRIIREEADLLKKTYVLVVEGPAGGTGHFQIRSFPFSPVAIEGAEPVPYPEPASDAFFDRTLVRVSFDEGDEPYPRKTIRCYYSKDP